MDSGTKQLQGKKDPKHVVVATASTPVNRAVLLAEIEAARSVRELATAVCKVLRLVKV